MAKVRQVTFAVKGSGSGGAGWIGKVDGVNGRGGVYFSHSQEYTTTDPHMIDALIKSGVAEIFNDEEVEESEAVGAPAGLDREDEQGNPNDLQFMTLMDLGSKLKGLGIPVPAKLNTKAKRIKAIEDFYASEKYASLAAKDAE